MGAHHPLDPDGECSDAELWQKICSGQYNFDDPIWENISDAAKDLINHLLVLDVDQRYDVDQLLSHPWITSGLNVHANIDVDNMPITPMTPITPMIDSNLKSFQQKKRYNVYTPTVNRNNHM